MLRPLFARGTVRNLNVLVLATLLAVTAFAYGRAGAARSGFERRRTHVVEVVDHAAPAVVSVFAEKRTRRNTRIRSAGSGVFIHPAGYIVTNSHVIRGGGSLRVELWGSRGSLPARLVANLPGNDLALLKVRGKRAFPYVSIAPSGAAMLGETVIAIGNPRGLGDTITVGVVSALGRDAKLRGGAALYNLIQTDASINTGNSGGALLNLDGELLGVVVSMMPSSQGIAFAIPGEQVRALLRRALGSAPGSKRIRSEREPAPIRPAPGAPGRVSSTRVGRPSLPPPSQRPATPGPPRQRPSSQGPQARPTPRKTRPLNAEDFGLTLRDTGTYLQVTRVARDSAATLADVKVGDLLVAIDGRPIDGELDLVLALSAARPGRVYQLHLRRLGAERHVALVTPR